MARKPSAPRISTVWLPALIGGLLCILTVLAGWFLHENQLVFQHDTILERTRLYTADIQIDLHSRIPALQRIVDRWEFRGGTPREEFVRDAQAYQMIFPVSGHRVGG